MAFFQGPNIVTDGLVFGYDAGYGVADNVTSTRFYPGEPTTNLYTNSDFSNGETGWTFASWDGNISHTATTVTGPNGNVVSANKLTVNSGSSYSHFHQGNGGKYTSGNTYTTSALVKGVGTFAIKSHWGGNTNFTMTGDWQRVSMTVTASSSSSSNFPYFAGEGLTVGSDFYITDAQTELKSHATPFVNGTRSNTAGLIDLKRTTDIDVSNVSFDSTGQPTFDGTDDRIGLGDNFDLNDHFSDGGDFSIEVITKMKESASQNGGVLCNQKYQSEADPAGFGLVIRSSNQYALNLTNNTPISYENLASIPFNQDEYHHIVYTFESSTGKVVSYSNGTQYTSITNSSYSWNIPTDSTRTYIGYNTQGGWGNYINMDIPIAKVYGRALSADEVQQNYNAYKKRFNI